MKLITKFFLLFLVISPLIIYSQYLEEEMFLPDSFGCFFSPSEMVWDSVRDRIYARTIYGADRILVLDCESDLRLRPIDVTRGYHGGTLGLGYNPVNNCLYIKFLYLPESKWQPDTLFVVDCANHQIVKKIRMTGTSVLHFAVNTINNKVYLTTVATDTFLYIIDGRRNEIIKRIFFRSPGGANPIPPFIWNSNANRLYLIPHQRPKIYVIDGVTDSIIDSINTHPNFPIHYEMTWTERWDRLHILAKDHPDFPTQFFILVIDLERNRVVREIPVSFGHTAYNSISDRLYIATGEKLEVVDFSLGRIVDSVFFPRELADIKYTRQNHLYCFYGGYDSIIAVMDCGNNQIIDSINIRGTKYGEVFYHPIREKLYLTTMKNGGITIVDCLNRQLKKEMCTGVNSVPLDLILNPLTNKLYVGEPENPWVMVFEAEQNRSVNLLKLIDYIEDDRGLMYGAVCTTLNKVYLAWGEKGVIVVLDGSTDSILKVITDIPEYKKLYYLEGLNKIFAVPPCELMLLDPWTYIIDCNTDEVIDQILTDYPTWGFGYSPRTNKVYIASGYGEGVKTRIIDGVNNRVIKVIDNVSGDIEYDPRDERFYISDGSPPPYVFRGERASFTSRGDTFLPPRGLFILNGYTDSIIHYIQGGEGWAIALNTIDNRIYAASSDRGNYFIKVVDLESNCVIDTIDIFFCDNLFWNPINNKLYVAQFWIEVIDCRTNRVIWRYPPGYKELIDMETVLWHPRLNRLYLPSIGKSKLLVIRDEIPGIEEIDFGKGAKDFEILPTLGSSFQIFWRNKGEAKVAIYNVLGKKIKEFNMKPETYFIWNGRNERNKRLSSGVYFLKVKSGNNKPIATAKIILK